jgi:hypothetical protein
MIKSPPSGWGELADFGSLVFLLPKTFELFGFQIFVVIEPGEGYSRKVSCALN